ncbi:hypothetical protein A1343_04870 [Leptospira interrogans serovar Bataviae]|nr:hypothetical protein [Leptospira interrogans serovar Bataviae]OAM76782.1 hypothetical protein A1343_04870 [Leptospira interrogans serovar Bataviae]QOI33573.1 hypothetical protein LeptoLang_04600 [Leptospira interrogans serovar Icterohaemorrhagiae]QOI37667.1 hypothetical protein Lepto1548_04795 [Leptospira interrogans serovar Bataviae]
MKFIKFVIILFISCRFNLNDPLGNERFDNSLDKYGRCFKEIIEYGDKCSDRIENQSNRENGYCGLLSLEMLEDCSEFIY